MTELEPDLRERLKASLWFKVGTLVSLETKKLSQQHDLPINATPQFIGALTEMVWTQIENVAMDLEAFARHAGRSTVGTEDVLLMTRRNEALEGVLRKWLEIEVERGALEESGRKLTESQKRKKGKSVKRK